MGLTFLLIPHPWSVVRYFWAFMIVTVFVVTRMTRLRIARLIARAQAAHSQVCTYCGHDVKTTSLDARCPGCGRVFDLHAANLAWELAASQNNLYDDAMLWYQKNSVTIGSELLVAIIVILFL